MTRRTAGPTRYGGTLPVSARLPLAVSRRACQPPQPTVKNRPSHSQRKVCGSSRRHSTGTPGPRIVGWTAGGPSICSLSLDRMLTLVAGLASPFGASAEAPEMTTRVGRLLDRKPAYPVCPHWSWRGGRRPGRRPPSEPPASRAAAGAPGGPGAPPWAPPPDPRTGALTAQRRTVVVAARIARADQAVSGPAEALQLPNVGERANEVVSGLSARWLDAFVRIADRRLHPPGGRFVAFPQGSIAPQARAGSDPEPETTGVTSAAFPGRRSSDRRGVAPNPAFRPEPRVRSGRMRANRSNANGFRDARWRELGSGSGSGRGC